MPQGESQFAHGAASSVVSGSLAQRERAGVRVNRGTRTVQKPQCLSQCHSTEGGARNVNYYPSVTCEILPPLQGGYNSMVFPSGGIASLNPRLPSGTPFGVLERRALTE